jgi:aarF domain-containing kinase
LPDLFASVISMRVKKQDLKRLANHLEKMSELSQYEQSVRMKKKLKEFLQDTDRMPKELIFLLRNMRQVILRTSCASY